MRYLVFPLRTAASTPDIIRLNSLGIVSIIFSCAEIICLDF
ncbi:MULTISPECIES: hypothetical protein [Bacteroides]|uniref:Uncharacterized protein n=1 Tax=Bacteroides uniformis TaxID=820 RepID=A0AAW6GB41_BACUN|nr:MULTISPECIES: hypothetical protein [Bacteroides]MDC1818955.1 hypothetical protein [Bacteroides uniformis]MDC1830933.1 hypothetical protein [Bacteroides uniformis]MDC1855325.1 hypothetical protein [Bacteroides uniformis]MDC1859477.1 hypothetical protein [Bacteroides uniformis]MDC1872102.1 hypothetical protein [Bacteroides uniformis]